MKNEGGIRKSDYFVCLIPHRMAIKFIREHHYSKGASNTHTYGHGLFRKGNLLELIGVAMWLPPTRVACESVNKSDWKKVISLTRLAVHPDVPKNAASYLIAASIRMIKKDGRFISLVTYADESQGHSGAIYRATNWTYAGRTGPYPKWMDSNGKQVAQKSTVNRINSRMIELGHTKVGSFFKHKFVIHLDVNPTKAKIKPIKDEQETLF